MAYTLTITQDGKPRGVLVFAPAPKQPLEGSVDTSGLHHTLSAELERIATIDEGSLWSPTGTYFAPLRLGDWFQLTAAVMELGRRLQGLAFKWSSTPPLRLIQSDEPPGTIF